MNYKIPKFYGIQEIDFIYHGEWADPEVKYKDQFFNYYELEESLYEIFNEENNDKDFKKWVIENKSKVFEILDVLRENIIKRKDKEGMIYKVKNEDLVAYLDAWLNKKELPLPFDLMYCEENGIFIALDNSFGECYVEEFDTEKEALLWLNSYEKEEIKMMNIDDSIFNLKVDYEKGEENFEL